MRAAFSDSVSVGVGVNLFAPNSKAYHEIFNLTVEIAEELGYRRPK
jgi:hypothetical protein